MPFAFCLVGIVLIVSGVRGTQDELYRLVVGDVTGPHNFLFWCVAILALGSFGYIKPLKPFVDAFLALALIALVISDKGVFAQFMGAIETTTTKAPADSAQLKTA